MESYEKLGFDFIAVGQQRKILCLWYKDFIPVEYIRTIRTIRIWSSTINIG